MRPLLLVQTPQPPVGSLEGRRTPPTTTQRPPSSQRPASAPSGRSHRRVIPAASDEDRSPAPDSTAPKIIKVLKITADIRRKPSQAGTPRATPIHPLRLRAADISALIPALAATYHTSLREALTEHGEHLSTWVDSYSPRPPAAPSPEPPSQRLSLRTPRLYGGQPSPSTGRTLASVAPAHTTGTVESALPLRLPSQKTLFFQDFRYHSITQFLRASQKCNRNH